MIVSHRHRFIFIKGIKVAGTSVEIALSQLCGEQDVVTPITPIDERLRLGTAGEPRNYSDDPDAEREFLAKATSLPAAELRGLKPPKAAFYNHMPLTEVLERLPEAQAYQLLFVERSPYAKVLSYANWDANYAAYMSGRPLPKSPEAIGHAVQRTIDDGSILKVRNIDRYRDLDGRIGSPGWRFETVDDSLKAFARACGATPLPLPHAKEGFASERIDAASALTPEQLDYINEAFAEEFELFGYRRHDQTRCPASIAD